MKVQWLMCQELGRVLTLEHFLSSLIIGFLLDGFSAVLLGSAVIGYTQVWPCSGLIWIFLFLHLTFYERIMFFLISNNLLLMKIGEIMRTLNYYN